jgi:hypothetical protein
MLEYHLHGQGVIKLERFPGSDGETGKAKAIRMYGKEEFRGFKYTLRELDLRRNLLSSSVK